MKKDDTTKSELESKPQELLTDKPDNKAGVILEKPPLDEFIEKIPELHSTIAMEGFRSFAVSQSDKYKLSSKTDIEKIYKLFKGEKIEENK